MLRDSLRREGFVVGRKHVRTLMTRMGVEPLYRRPRTTRKHPGHEVYPYLLRGLAIERANHVWAMDISVPQQAAWEMRERDVSTA
jgi:putative transposase